MRFQFFSLLILFSCSQPPTDNSQLSEEQQRLPEFSLSSFESANGLEVSLFAHEPILVNPTNIDVDHKGRVWVCEGHNYRLPLNPDKDGKPEGDRILILEDTDLDGKADKQTVFYQGNDVNAALGISVLGNKVIISKSPNVLVFTDADGDDKPESKEILFTGMDAIEHDHAIHALTFGPDGKYYFNAGNEIHQMMYPDGSPVIDLAGNKVNDSGNPYRQGMVFRSNMDGSDLETLGWNFRNPYELAVDSYGNIWQSDNDDDGNRGTRLNLVLEYGNYGFTDEKTGAGWRTKRTGMAEEIPLRHWHLNDPGVVPNVLQLYAGSPTGILFYEGDLLPDIYQNGLIHAEAGVNVIRSYPVDKHGYGYKSKIQQILKASDPWFRPSDVCVAPDGSIIVADWYDPGVGGHLVGDQERGRIFRIAPTGTSYSIPNQDFVTISGLIQALKSPNQSTRYLAWTGLRAKGDEAKPALMELFKENKPTLMARALWLLDELDPVEAFQLGMFTKNEDLQVTAIKIARQKLSGNLMDYLRIEKNAAASVKRELAIALRFQKSDAAIQMWAQLATQYQGDRWFLEALGIGSDLNAEACFEAWLTEVGDNWHKGTNKDIVWRVRSAAALPLLVNLILEAKNIEDTYRYFRAFDFHQSDDKNLAIESLLSKTTDNKEEFLKLAFRHLDREYVVKSPNLKTQLIAVTESYRGTDDFLLTIQKYQLQQYNEELLQLIFQVDKSSTNATRYLLQNESGLIHQIMEGSDEQKISTTIAALGAVGNKESLDLLESYMMETSNPLALRQHAARYFATSWNGQNSMLDLLANDDLPADLVQPAAASLASSWRPGIRKEAAKYLDMEENQNDSKLPGISELVTRQGDPVAGSVVFEKLCQSCHVVNGVGTDFGPGLSEIGSKLSKEAMFASILKPDAGISFGYEGYMITLNDGSRVTGLIQSRTSDDITVKLIGGASSVFSIEQVSSIEQLDTSLMTPNLHTLMDQQELINLVSFLEELKTPT